MHGRSLRLSALRVRFPRMIHVYTDRAGHLIVTRQKDVTSPQRPHERWTLDESEAK